MINSNQVKAAVNNKVNLTILLGDVINRVTLASKNAWDDAYRHSCGVSDEIYGEEGITPERRAYLERGLLELQAKARQQEAFARRVAEAADLICSVSGFVMPKYHDSDPVGESVV